MHALEKSVIRGSLVRKDKRTKVHACNRMNTHAAVHALTYRLTTTVKLSLALIQ